jgi:uncharacterized protein
VPADPGATCANHRRRSAAATCSLCVARICTECVVPTPVGIKCGRCTGAGKAAGPVGGRRPRSAGGARPGGRSTALRRFGAAAVVASVALVGGVGLALRGDDSAPSASGAPRPVADAAAGIATESVVAFTGAEGLRMRGSLRVPDEVAGPAPGVVIIPGFGPTNRDGVAPPGGPADRLYRDLALRFAEAGVASIRYDKRGTGESPMAAEQTLRFDDMVADATAALAFLSERAETDPAALALVGHDEGGLIALRVAAADPRVGAVVLISTPGRPLADVLADDLMASAADPSHGEESAEALRDAVDRLLRTGHMPAPDALPGALRPVFPPGAEEYVTAIFSFDPAAEARAVDVPVLIVRGEHDSGVSAQDADRLREALRGDTDVLVGAGAGHTLALAGPPGDHAPAAQAATGDAAHDRAMSGAASSGIVRDDDLLDEIAAWLAGTLGADAPRTAAGSQHDDAVTVRITAEGLAFEPDQHHLPAGTYRFTLVNDDDVDHELQLAISGQHHTHLAGVGPVAPGTSDSFVIELAPGSYEFACHLPGHFEAGMVGTVRVR